MENSDPFEPPRSRLSVRHFLPTLGTLVLLVCVIVPFLLVTSGQSMQGTIAPGPDGGGYQRTRSVWRIGSGIVTLTTTNEGGTRTSEFEIGWLAAVFFLVPAFVLARWIAGRVERARSPATARLVLVGVPLATVMLSVFGGGLASRMYWGYWWDRPSTAAFVDGVREVTQLSFVESVVSPDGSLRSLVPDDNTNLDEELVQLPDDPYYALPARLLAPLAETGRIPERVPPLDEGALQLAVDDLVAMQSFAAPDPGYRNFQEMLHGVVMLVETDRGPALLAGLSGGEISNDHRPHDEFRIEWTSDGAPVLAQHQRFYYDIAGLEGAEWSAIALALSAAGAVACVLVAIGAGYKRRGPVRSAPPA